MKQNLKEWIISSHSLGVILSKISLSVISLQTTRPLLHSNLVHVHYVVLVF